MDITYETLTGKDDRKLRSACCNTRVQIVYHSITTTREAVVYTCNACQRLYVVDSRDSNQE